MTCRARSCQAVTPPAVITPSDSVARTRIAAGSNADARILGSEQVGIRPVPGARPAVDQAGLGHEQRTGTDRGDERSRGMHRREPGGLASEPASVRAVVIGVYRSQTMTTS